jgi:predicted nucleic acid-binding protein
MARQTLVLDASVGVKWFSASSESYVPQARAIMAAHANGEISLMVPDLFFHEISNALVCKKTLPLNLVEQSITTLFDLGLAIFIASEQSIHSAVQIARKAGITEYYACYLAAAIENSCPLITANPRHQKQELGCQVIPIEQWGIENREQG